MSAAIEIDQRVVRDIDGERQVEIEDRTGRIRPEQIDRRVAGSDQVEEGNGLIRVDCRGRLAGAHLIGIVEDRTQLGAQLHAAAVDADAADAVVAERNVDTGCAEIGENVEIAEFESDAVVAEFEAGEGDQVADAERDVELQAQTRRERDRNVAGQGSEAGQVEVECGRRAAVNIETDGEDAAGGKVRRRAQGQFVGGESERRFDSAFEIIQLGLRISHRRRCRNVAEQTTDKAIDVQLRQLHADQIACALTDYRQRLIERIACSLPYPVDPVFGLIVEVDDELDRIDHAELDQTNARLHIVQQQAGGNRRAGGVGNAEQLEDLALRRLVVRDFGVLQILAREPGDLHHAGRGEAIARREGGDRTVTAARMVLELVPGLGRARKAADERAGERQDLVRQAERRLRPRVLDRQVAGVDRVAVDDVGLAVEQAQQLGVADDAVGRAAGIVPRIRRRKQRGHLRGQQVPRLVAVEAD